MAYVVSLVYHRFVKMRLIVYHSKLTINYSRFLLVALSQSLVGDGVAFLRNTCLIPSFAEKNCSKVSEGVVEVIVISNNEKVGRRRNTRQSNLKQQLSLGSFPLIYPKTTSSSLSRLFMLYVKSPDREALLDVQV